MNALGLILYIHLINFKVSFASLTVSVGTPNIKPPLIGISKSVKILIAFLICFTLAPLFITSSILSLPLSKPFLIITQPASFIFLTIFSLIEVALASQHHLRFNGLTNSQNSSTLLVEFIKLSSKNQTPLTPYLSMMYFKSFTTRLADCPLKIFFFKKKKKTKKKNT